MGARGPGADYEALSAWNRPGYECPAEALRWRLSTARDRGGVDFWEAWPMAVDAVLASITNARVRAEWRAAWVEPMVVEAFWLAYCGMPDERSRLPELREAPEVSGTREDVVVFT